MTNRISVALFVGSILGAAGCFPVSSYHSARTLEDGESSWGMTFSSTTYSDPDPDPDTNNGSITVPGIIPEFSYHVGVAENVEVGGRVAPGFLYGEIDMKYRFFQNGPLHLAVAPAIGQMAFIIAVTTLRLPLLLTYDLNDKVSLNLSATASSWVVSDNSSDSSIFAEGDEFMSTAGGGIGLEIRGRTTYFRPTLEITRAVAGQNDNSEAFQIAQLSLHFGFISGREMKKLDQMQQQLDRIERSVSSWKARFAPVASADQ